MIPRTKLAPLLVAMAGACGGEGLPPAPCSPTCLSPSLSGDGWRNPRTGDVLSFVGGNPVINQADGRKTSLNASPFEGTLPESCNAVMRSREFDSLVRVQDGFRLVMKAAPGATFGKPATSVASLRLASGMKESLLSSVEVSPMGDTLTATVVIARELSGSRVRWSLRWQLAEGPDERSRLDGAELDARFVCSESVCALSLEEFYQTCLR